VVRAARLIEHDESLKIEELELSPPGPDEVRVDLAFGGVNPVDRYTARGEVAPDGPLPRTLGGEASGTVEGRPVVVSGGGLGGTRDGVWATEAVVARSCVMPLPPGIDLRQAAATPFAGVTAWNVVQLAAVTSDDRVLVLGAGGGVGLAVVSLVGSLGASVWGQTGNEGKAEAIREHGAEEVAVSGASGLAEAVRDLRPTVVIDSLGSGFTQAALASLVPGGRLVIFGTSAGAQGDVDLRSIYRKGLRILGYAGLRLSDDERRDGLLDALGAVSDGRMHIAIGRILPLDQVNEAFDLLTDRAVTGKVLLDLS
jgi:NADPH:quinone reductase